MRKLVEDGYIVFVGDKGSEITKEEYDAIMEAIKNKPSAPDGFAYKLKDTIEWELVDAEIGVTEESNTPRKLTAMAGYVITNGTVYGKEIYLGVNDKAENWHEITDEEYATIVAEEESKAEEERL